MEVTTAQWVFAVVGFLGGGAVGAVITQIVTTYRARRQPIIYTTRTTTIFAGQDGNSNSTVTKLVMKRAEEVIEYDNLHAVELEIKNAGNTDFSSFKFGVNLPQHQSIVRVECTPPDRHHSVALEAAENTGSLGVLSQAMDVTLSPFNRGDRYSLVLQITLEPEGSIEDRLSLSTPHAVKFTRALDRTDLAKLAILGVEVSVSDTARLIRAIAK